MPPLSKVPFLVLVSFGVLSLQACASAGHLAEYDFRDRAVASVIVDPPEPQIFSEGFWSPEGGSWWEGLIRVGTEIARDVQIEETREKLREASESVDVAGILADRVLVQSSQLLRARAVKSVQDADFEIETWIRQYGIQANSWDSQASFFVDAEVLLFESETGRKVWDAEVDARDPINPSAWGLDPAWGSIITARALASLSVEEIRLALESLADFTAERITAELARGLERAGKR